MNRWIIHDQTNGALSPETVLHFASEYVRLRNRGCMAWQLMDGELSVFKREGRERTIRVQFKPADAGEEKL